ncbi:hypothetical protein E2C01_041671 [Portunus trituberculatus]|uniref:Uncharacterized protein n=1 Tax=Portunus trituberculatus TaxID=210409 RepID=A0A5B7FJV0_PORTR|nr:hypothetical protein [Portunus trituberculatus]
MAGRRNSRHEGAARQTHVSGSLRLILACLEGAKTATLITSLQDDE